MDGWMAAFLGGQRSLSAFQPSSLPSFPPVSPANCVNGKATEAFANFAATATRIQQHRILHKCIYILYLSDGRALYCSYVLDGPAKWRSEPNKKESLKQNQQSSRSPFLNTLFGINSGSILAKNRLMWQYNYLAV
ncbi:LOW QUALITY PROTEIN: uncharacterized protein Dana_GF27901 [Drosophila ananassae]|uniref:Uncharacterized protein n=1 Tax=Drosophila ananassae TaxID=7217 RepID=A0A0P8Y4E3_DROAN|nr:LOW QUALITY PROTEIN: uncharacterized protein Dana_GF27901 [Drosophila ananassae]